MCKDLHGKVHLRQNIQDMIFCGSLNNCHNAQDGVNNIKYSEDWVGTVGRMMNEFKYSLPSSKICCKITNEI